MSRFDCEDAAIAPKKEFTNLAPGSRFFPRWRYSHPWTHNAGPARTGHHFYTFGSSHSGERISMGQKVALNSSSMATSSLPKNQVEKGELSRSIDAAEATAQDFTSNIQVFRRELRQVVNAELLLDPSDFVHHAFKALFAEKLVFLLFKVFA